MEGEEGEREGEDARAGLTATCRVPLCLTRSTHGQDDIYQRKVPSYLGKSTASETTRVRRPSHCHCAVVLCVPTAHCAVGAHCHCAVLSLGAVGAPSSHLTAPPFVSCQPIVAKIGTAQPDPKVAATD